jgi:hypothetical protein
MLDLFDKLSQTPLPTILVVVGFLFLFVGLGGQFTAHLITDHINTKVASWVGVILLIIGIFIYIVPTAFMENSIQSEQNEKLDSKKTVDIDARSETYETIPDQDKSMYSKPEPYQYKGIEEPRPSPSACATVQNTSNMPVYLELPNSGRVVKILPGKTEKLCEQLLLFDAQLNEPGQQASGFTIENGRSYVFVLDQNTGQLSVKKR